MGKTNGNGWTVWAAGVVVLAVGGYVAFDNNRATAQAVTLTVHGADIAAGKAVQARVEAAVLRNAEKLDRLLERTRP